MLVFGLEMLCQRTCLCLHVTSKGIENSGFDPGPVSDGLYFEGVSSSGLALSCLEE